MIEDVFRTGKAYTIRETARLANIPTVTAKRWLYGYTVDGKVRSIPVFGRKDESPWVSFLELAELVIVARFRERRVPLDTLRIAHQYAAKETGERYPFASLKLAKFGPHVLHQFAQANLDKPSLVVLDRNGQYMLPGIVAEEIKHFEHDVEDELAQRWFPLGPDVPLVVDPHYAGGQPTIKGRGVTLAILLRRWKAGEKIESIAENYRLDPALVEDVLRLAA